MSGTQLKVHFKLSGQPVDEERKRAYQPPPSGPPTPDPFGQLYFLPRLADAAGNQAMVTEWGMTIPRQGPVAAEFTAVLPGPGRYQLTLGNADGAPSVAIEIP
ncbi:MAG: hypothetical protein M3R21_04355 [Candidatus Dormibacteraeota bacterium]|nr:hypothetical protein [Candidatus Dormibacteraeota bacterium]